MLGEHSLGFDGAFQVPCGEELGSGSLEDARVGLTDVEERLTEAEQLQLAGMLRRILDDDPGGIDIT